MTLVGRQIGRYRILEQLGSGGMSVVYKGLDTALDREVAVKVLHPHLAGRDESRRRLAREAKAVARLHHPNILEVFDFSAADAQNAYIVTEYIRGRTLRQYLDEGGIDPPEIAAMIIHELAAALAHAHEEGVIHRDLKPENVMVREDGVLKLMDFGIAKLLETEERMTVTGTLVGSPAHMAPEIIEGLEAGPEADVFSLGIMLYAFVTGRLPFTASNTTATLKRILDGTYEDPRRRVASLSDELAEIIARCLQRDRHHRYPSAGGLRDALADYLTGLGFPRVNEELASFFADPPSYKKAARQRIVTVLLERSEHLLAEKRTPRALASLNQVLALDAQNTRALALLDGLNRAKRRKLWIKRGIQSGVALVVLAVLGTGGYFLLSSEPDTGEPARPEAPPPDPPTRPTNPVPTPPESPTAPQAADPGLNTPLQPPTPLPVPTEEEPSDDAATHKKPVVRPEPRIEAPRPSKVRTSILVRPYGAVQVDNEAPSPQPLAQHDLELTPGQHTVTVRCEWCEDAVETINVVPGTENVFRLRAQLKPSKLSFDYQPAEAQVRVGEERRTARESQERPFDIRSPRGPASFQHRVEYEVSHPGYRTEKRVVMVEPGKPITLRGSLVAE
ncbi:serine/threonine-protein kinase [Hyalangium minutum]|uniref:non-specific serine/threonine protein kinase n=1 Tax=Hyalangium minutum TaxID=394096 RepID=A0A085WSF3_9BACT|nr:serine/threonine-protein kinase [Hyalangium minutum]KFE70616.1 serine/threonine protein kinase [Hyalangium minutum]